MSVTVDRTLPGCAGADLHHEAPSSMDALLESVDRPTHTAGRHGAFRARRAKIVCTLGPSSQTLETIGALIEAGMDVARLNFSHGTREQHLATYRRVREAADACGRAVCVLADLQGPKVRLGRFVGGTAVLERGALFTVTAAGDGAGEAVAGSSRRATTSYAALPRDVAAGDTLLIDDGRVRLCALESTGNDVVCTVIDGGVISDHKGITLPGVRMSVPTLSDKDTEDLRFALAMGVDMVALSFVRRPEDIEAVHQVMDACGRRVPVIAKLEREEAVDRLADIVAAFDGLMVARGDLGVEMPLEQLPLIQKRAVRLARESCKPVIVATQMLESMTHDPRPTRAEVSDVANAVLDGADALMLSGETSVGAYPVETVTTMARIIVATERAGLATLPSPASTTPAEAIAASAPEVALSVDAQALVAFTETGMSARRLSRHRCHIPILVFTPHAAVRSQLALTWGVETFVVPLAGHTDEMVLQVERALLELGRCRTDDLIVIVAGTLTGESGSTNLLRIHRVGESGQVPPG
ncbi:MAG: pyruvate kinase [Chloroflexi bacterium]|nr:pyruvate kinase [Chloroflexota bacterium]